MAEKTISTRQKQKYDTSTNWATNNIVLLAGEIGIESDTNKFKVGNGTSAWNELDYAGGSEIPLYSTTGQNTDGAMTQKATTDALPQAVTVTLTESQNFNDIVITNEQFDLLLSNPENYLIVEMTSSNLTVSLKYRRSQYTSMSVEGASQEMLIFECVNSTSLSFAPYAQRIDSLTVIKQTQNGESVIVVTDDTLDFTTFVPNNRTINGKSLANNIILTATDVNALPDTTEIPSTLADLTEDSSHRTVTDAEKTTWNAKSDFSGSYNDLTDKPAIPTNTSDLTNDSNFVSDSVYVHTDNNYTTSEKNKLAGIETGAEVNTVTSVNGKTGAITLSADDVNALPNTTVIPTNNNQLINGAGYTKVTVNNVAQSTINFDSDPQTQINNIVNNTTLIQNSSGGFNAGTNSVAHEGGAIGKNASSLHGGSIGNTAITDEGGAVGYQAISTNGGAIGQGTQTSNGFAGGYNAKTISGGLNIDAIQLGTGTNTQTKTLQVYDDNIYDANTHNLSLLGSFSALNNIGGGFSISDPVNVGIELGRKDGTSGTPYIDFHTDGQASTDFNSRILASGSELQITASGGVSINGYNIASVIQEYMSGTTGYLRLNTGDREYLICWGVISQSFRDKDQYNFTLPNNLTYNNQSWHLSVTADGYTDAAQLNGRVSANNGFYLQSQRYSNRTQDLVVSWQASGFVS